jgi:hypothetical protein
MKYLLLDVKPQTINQSFVRLIFGNLNIIPLFSLNFDINTVLGIILYIFIMIEVISGRIKSTFDGRL